VNDQGVDFEAMVHRRAQIDLEAKLVTLVARLGVWVLIVVVIQFVEVLALLFLIWRAIVT